MFSVTLFGASYLFAAPLPIADDGAKAEQKHWQGSWKILQMDITTGDRTARLKFKQQDEAAWRVKDDRLEIIGLNFPYSGAKLRFDAATDPKHLTLTLLEGGKSGPKVLATYTREGDGIEIELIKWPRDKDGETVKLRLMLKRIKD